MLSSGQSIVSHSNKEQSQGRRSEARRDDCAFVACVTKFFYKLNCCSVFFLTLLLVADVCRGTRNGSATGSFGRGLISLKISTGSREKCGVQRLSSESVPSCRSGHRTIWRSQLFGIRLAVWHFVSSRSRSTGPQGETEKKHHWERLLTDMLVLVMGPGLLNKGDAGKRRHGTAAAFVVHSS